MSYRAVARGLLAAAVLLPPGALRAAPNVCLFRAITRRPCPTCGMTRSWQSSAHMRLGDGFRSHPVGPLALAATGWLAIDPDAEGRLARVPRAVWVALSLLWTMVWLDRLRRPTPSA